MRKLTILFLFFLLATPLIASEQTSVDYQKLQRTNLEKRAGGFNLSLEISDNENYSLFDSNNSSLTNNTSKNEEIELWPMTSRMFRLPPTGGAYLIFDTPGYELIEDENLFWQLREKYEELYGALPESDNWYPENPVEISDPAILHDFRVASLKTHLYQINPALKQVRGIQNINVDINFDNSSDQNTLPANPVRISSSFLPWYRQLLDWEESELDDYEVYRGKVQVISQNTVAIQNAMLPWIEWKEQKGWELEFLTPEDVSSWTRNEILNELQNRYNSSNPKFDFIVIIGDASGSIYVPPGFPGGAVYGAGDHDYSCLSGNDDLLDVIVGRISVESIQQLVAYVNKVQAYERDPYIADTQWYRRGSVAAGSESSGISTVFTCEYAKQAMLDHGFTSVYSAYYNDGGGNVNTRTINNVNQGAAFHLYRGYLGSGLSNGEIGSLLNYYKLPVVIDITCGRGNWADETGNNEAWMRAGNATTFKGAIGAISTATSGTHTRFNNSLAGGGVFSVFVLNQKTLGEMYMGAKLNMWNNLAGYQPQVESFNEWLNLMGDPTVWIWTDIPRELTVTAPTTIELGTNGYEVQVMDNGAPLSGAWVTLYKFNNGDDVIARGISDDDGIIYLNTDISHTGEAILTVTAQNAHPFRQTVNVNLAQNRIGYEDITILDNGTVGTSGNGNGIAESGETVGLLINLKNYGQSQADNISITASSSDENAVSVNGNPTHNTLNAGSSTQLNTPILVEIDDDAPDTWNIPVSISFGSTQGTYEDTYNLNVSASRYVFVLSVLAGNFEPGGNDNVEIAIYNGGHSAGNQATVTLTSNNDWLTINNSNGTLAGISVNSALRTSSFSISADEEAFKGYPAPATLLIEENGGRTHQLNITIPIGQQRGDDPSGPDEYGYFAFESSDLDYLLRPAYNWIEINPQASSPDHNGTRLNLPDYGDNEDCSIAVNLPFDFTFYGETYNMVTVCSNGWIAMGDQTDMALGRNWTIPTPLGPSSMIAPMWDDRIVPVASSNGGVFYYGSPEDGIAVFEWDNVADATNSNPNTFQLVLYEESNSFPTPTGDNEFVFQYETVNPSTGSFSAVPYFTAGIENSTQTDGILMAYYNNPGSGATEIVNETAILFTTRTQQAGGQIYGQVTYSDNNEPIEGIRVSASGISTVDYTDDEGNYQISVLPGTVSVRFERSGFTDVVVNGVSVNSNESVEVNAQMERPNFVIDPHELTVHIDPGQTESVDLTATNFADFAIDYEGEIIYSGSGPGGEVGQLLNTYNPGNWPVETIPVDIAYFEDYFWVLANDYNSNTIIFKLEPEGNIINTYQLNQGDAVSIQIHNDQFIVLTLNQIITYEYSELSGFDEVSTVNHSVPMDYYQGAWYDPIDNVVYRGDWISVSKVALNGQVQDTIEIDSGGMELWMSDLEIVSNDPDDLYLHIMAAAFDETGGSLVLKVFRANMEDNEIEQYVNVPLTGWMNPTGMTINQGIQSVNTELTTLSERENGFGITVDVRSYFENTDWISLSPASGNVPAGEETTITLNIDGTEMHNGDIYDLSLSFDYGIFPEPIVIPVTIISGTSPVETSKKELPEEWSINSVWPNPFNPTTNIKFSLMAQADVKLYLYNVLGQQVQTIINRPMQAGVHTASIDGSQLASGIYFLQLQAGPLQDVRKIILMK